MISDDWDHSANKYHHMELSTTLFHQQNAYEQTNWFGYGRRQRGQHAKLLYHSLPVGFWIWISKSHYLFLGHTKQLKSV